MATPQRTSTAVPAKPQQQVQAGAAAGVRNAVEALRQSVAMGDHVQVLDERSGCNSPVVHTLAESMEPAIQGAETGYAAVGRRLSGTAGVRRYQPHVPLEEGSGQEGVGDEVIDVPDTTQPAARRSAR